MGGRISSCWLGGLNYYGGGAVDGIDGSFDESGRIGFFFSGRDLPTKKCKYWCSRYSSLYK